MNKVKYLLLIIFCMFISYTNVQADSLECHYNYTVNQNVNLVLSIDVTYDGTKVLLTKKIPTYQNTIIKENLPDTIQTTYIRNSNGNLSCPFFSVKFDMKSSGRSVTYDLDFKINEKPNGYTRLDAYDKKIDDSGSSSNNQGNTDKSNNNSSNGNETSDILYTCVYNDKTSNKNVFSFIIKKNGYGSNFTGLGTYGDYSITRDTTESFTKCPTYINSTCNVTYKICNIKLNDSSGNWVYVGAGTNTDGVNTNLITLYVEYNNSSASKVQILKDDATGGYRLVADTNAIEKSNLSEVKTKIDSKNFPKYLIKSKGSDTYLFTDTKPDEFDKLYINVKYLTGIQGLGEAEIYKTCEEMFGESFLKWLDENVFIVIRIAVPILLILLTSFDFAKVVFSDDKEGMSNAFKRFTKRAIAAILIFLTPSIIMLIANLIGGDELKAVTDCVNYIENMHE